MFVYMNQPQKDPACTALAEVQRVGFKAADVRHIVLTHLDFDHAGGLSDFPNATVHLTRREAEAGERRHGVIGKGRYRPKQWAGIERWKRYVPQGDKWFGFDAVRQMDGLPPEILLIPLRGHTEGHAGVAVKTDDGRWLLNAGDAYFWREEVRRPDRKCTPGLEAYQTMMEVDRPARLRNQQRVRELSLDHAGEVTVFCSHDVSEYRMLSGRAPQPSVA
jgi:glyoxylase-like metal-dependent hydrolase (beta-lactamase superfamily II)